MPDDHPLLGTNDRNQAHDPVFQAALVAERQAAEGVAPEKPAEPVEDDEDESDDDAEPDPIDTKKRARHEKPDADTTDDQEN